MTVEPNLLVAIDELPQHLKVFQFLGVARSRLTRYYLPTKQIPSCMTLKFSMEIVEARFILSIQTDGIAIRFISAQQIMVLSGLCQNKLSQKCRVNLKSRYKKKQSVSVQQ